jgi:hypothetical protein
MDLVLLLHSIVRYLVLIAAVLGLIKAVVSAAQKSAGGKADGILSAAFLGLLDLQALLGLLIILLGGLLGPLHPLVMFIALVLAHWLSITIKKAQGPRTAWMRIALFVVPLPLILFGLLIIGQLRI